MIGEHPTLKRRATPKPKKAPPKSVSEIIDRLERLAGTGQKVPPVRVVGCFPGRLAFPTTADERERLRALLDRLDPSWAARLTIVAAGLPEHQPGSTATLATKVATDARAITAYPDSTDADVAHWAEDLIASDRSTKTSIRQGLIALWPDRSRNEAAAAMSLLVGCWPGRSGAEAPLLHADMPYRWLADQVLGARAAESLRWLLHPNVERAKAAESERKVLHDQLVALARHSTGQRDELMQLRADLRDATSRAETAESMAVDAQEKADELDDRRRREVRETAGRARDRLMVMAQDYARDFERFAVDIREYLDRSNPNVTAAMARADEIAELARRLEATD